MLLNFAHACGTVLQGTYLAKPDFSKTTGPISIKLGRNNPLVISFKTYSKNLILSESLVATAIRRNFLRNTLKNVLSETTGQILT